MKKLISLLGVIVILLIMSVSAFAGSVPEDLLYSETAKVFIGTVENYTTKDIPTAPYTVIASVEVIPTEKIKGDVAIGVNQIYSRCHSSLELKTDAEYLFGYFDENNFYIYEIESREDEKFRLVDSDKNDMTKRIENYLNDGSFEKAEKERMSGSRPSSQQQSSSTSVIGGADEPTEIVVNSNGSIWVMVGVAAFVLVLIVLLLVFRKKK